ncbi:MAG: aquaporin Z [Labilithrix sp.]|nr:aquaporin Z [Labilithrix sp.]
MSLTKRAFAELLGTFWLVLGGCGAAVLAAKFPGVGIGYLGVALAFGLTVLTGAYALGAISGAHFNPAVTVGLTVARRFPSREVLPYIVAQVLGALVAAIVLYLIASGAPAFDSRAGGFAANGFGDHSPGQYSVAAALLCEIVMTFMFVTVILGVTDERTPSLKAFAPIAIGLTLTLIHLVSIPVTNTSVNPARSTGVALFAGGWALGQLWLFWLAPFVGAAIAGVVYPRVYPLAAGERPAIEAEPAILPPEAARPAPAH